MKVDFGSGRSRILHVTNCTGYRAKRIRLEGSDLRELAKMSDTFLVATVRQLAGRVQKGTPMAHNHMQDRPDYKSPPVADDTRIEVFGNWLRAPAEAAIRTLRKAMLRAVLQQFGVERVSDLTDGGVLDVAKSIGLTIPGPVVSMDLGAPYTPGPRQAIVKPVPATPVNETPDTNPVPTFAHPEQPYGGARARLEAKRAEMARKARERFEREEAADKIGELWTMQVAYYRDRAFAVVHQGRNDDTESFRSQHGGALIFMDPYPIIGSMSEAREHAAKIINAAELTIRFIERKKA